MVVKLEAPLRPRAVAFFDGQNLYRHAKEAFGHHHPNYDPHKLFNAVCATKSWIPSGIRFYTGIPEQLRQPMWHSYWSRRLLSMTRSGILTYKRTIKYRTEELSLPDGTVYEVDSAQEKGIDIRIAIDIMRMAVANQYDVAVIFSQDQDLTEVADEIRDLASSSKRWIKAACAYPVSPTASSNRGIAKTDWIRMDRAFYDACLDPHDYRPASSVIAPNPIPRIRLKEHGPY